MDKKDLREELEKRRSSSKAMFEELSEKLKSKLDSIDEEKERDLNIVSHEILTLVTTIKKQEDTIKDEIEFYYADRKSSLQQLANDAKKLYETQENVCTMSLLDNLSEAMTQLKTHCSSILESKAKFSKNFMIDNFSVGSFRKDIFNFNFNESDETKRM